MRASLPIALETWLAALLILICTVSSMAYQLSTPIIVDHTRTDLANISIDHINAAKERFKIYFGHTSHGSQIPVGLERIESLMGGPYMVAIDWNLPQEQGSLCIRDRSDTYDPQDFFPTVPQALEQNPNINVVIYGWCGQPGNNNGTLLQSYLQTMSQLEKQFPNVYFVYMTGHAQEKDCAGDTRYHFNESLRQYCRDNNKILFDFGDLDSWFQDEQHAYTSPSWCEHADEQIPCEHPQYHGDQAGHTTFESCEQKGKAFWRMLCDLLDASLPVPVELSSFQATPGAEGVRLEWITHSESNNYGFNVERSSDGSQFKSIGFLRGKGTTQKTNRYQFIDRTVAAGTTVWYRLVQLDYDGTTSYSSIVTVHTTTPESFNLYQNYPNPFNGSTQITFSLTERAHILLTIINSTGQTIKTLINSLKPPGLHKTPWDGTNNHHRKISSGIYFCALSVRQTDGRAFRIVKKMMLVN